MKTLTSAFLVATALFAGGCAAETSSGPAASMPNGESNVAMSSSGGSRHEIAAITASDREPLTTMRGDRGIPTPQPARDPGMLAFPQPQPPLPSPDPHHGFSSGYDARW